MWVRSAGAQQVKDLAREIAKLLAEHPHFVVWLNGPLGTGKTTLVREVLRQFGLKEGIPVTSPTYTYLNEYEIGGKKYAHLDLYRAQDGFSMENLGISDFASYAGVFIEWPRVIAHPPELAPTHEIEISYEDSDQRRYHLRF